MNQDERYKLINEVNRMISLNDADRTREYGTVGWKLLVAKLVQEMCFAMSRPYGIGGTK